MTNLSDRNEVIKMNVNKHVGLEIKFRREEKGWTATWLAKKLRIHTNSLSNYENGKNEMGYKVYIRICKLLKVGITEMLPDNWEELEKGV